MEIQIVVVCSLILSLGAALGANLQRLSTTREELKDEATERRPCYLQPLWCFGMIITILDTCGDFVFVGLVPLSLLAPLGSLSLGWNIVLAPMFHSSTKKGRNDSDAPKVTMICAVAIIYAGTMLTVSFAGTTSPTYNPTTIIQLLTTKKSLVYIFGCLVFQCAIVLHGSLTRRYGILHYSSLAGCLGGQSIICAKCASEIVENIILNGGKIVDDWNQSSLLYVLIFGMIVTVIAQGKCLNKSFTKYNPHIVIPIYQCCWNMFSILGGFILFQEYVYMNVFDFVMYALGIIITLLGIILLVKQYDDTPSLLLCAPTTSCFLGPILCCKPEFSNADDLLLEDIEMQSLLEDFYQRN